MMPGFSARRPHRSGVGASVVDTPARRASVSDPVAQAFVDRVARDAHTVLANLPRRARLLLAVRVARECLQEQPGLARFWGGGSDDEVCRELVSLAELIVDVQQEDFDG